MREFDGDGGEHPHHGRSARSVAPARDAWPLRRRAAPVPADRAGLGGRICAASAVRRPWACLTSCENGCGVPHGIEPESSRAARRPRVEGEARRASVRARVAGQTNCIISNYVLLIIIFYNYVCPCKPADDSDRPAKHSDKPFGFLLLLLLLSLSFRRPRAAQCRAALRHQGGP